MRAWRLFACLLACAQLHAESPPTVEDALAVSSRIMGGAFEVEAQPGDSLTAIGARHGVDVATLARANGLPGDARLTLGQRLRVENPHIVPRLTVPGAPDAILINVPQRMLFLFRSGEPEAAYPVAVGRPSWRTPRAELSIDERVTDKAWIVPPSIQDEMRREGEPVLTEVPPGPENPLGRHWLGLSPGSCGIHSTNVPTSIYSQRTHGCIRLHPDDAAALYERVAVGEHVRIIYQPILLAELADGRLCLEAHRDTYRIAPAPEVTLDRLAAGISHERLDRERALEILEALEGIARDVTRGGAGGACT